ncbi:HNH endonuclease [Ileibacterium valens]|uniref:HNH endonuclease n=1 Tax=Ileibacterium valens TaxID=1862668 RepID=UPI002729FEB0|nr:HNH endonuclease [Ileibacterium valens]
MSKLSVTCDMCGKEIQRYPSQIKSHNFCSKTCLAAFSSKRKNPDKYKELKSYSNIGAVFKQNNSTWNKTRMTPEVRSKLRKKKLGTGEGKSYCKLFGQLEHRVIAEQLLGRPLKSEEVVHHIDGDRRNNHPANLLVLTQSDHFKLHQLINRYKSGKNEEGSK